MEQTGAKYRTVRFCEEIMCKRKRVVRKMFKKLLFNISWIVLLVLAGCRGASPYAEDPSLRGKTIKLALDITTRADTDEAPDNFHLWIYNGSKLVKYIKDNPQWTTASEAGVDLKATLRTEVNAENGAVLNFYLLLNVDNLASPESLTPSQLKELTFALAASYGGDNKVPMSGTKNISVTAGQEEYSLSMDAVRSVAKVDIYCTRESDISTLSVNEISLHQAPEKGYLFGNAGSLVGSLSRILFTSSEGKDIGTVLSKTDAPDSGSFEAYKDYFTPMTLEQPYLFENLAGGENLQIKVYNQTLVDENVRYYIMLTYTLGGINYTSRVYLSKIERNAWYSIFIRISARGEISVKDVNCEVLPWEGKEMDIPAFE